MSKIFNGYNLIKKTRIKHNCAICGRKIDIGEEAYNYIGIFEGDFQNWHACKTCKRLEYYLKDEYCNPDGIGDIVMEKFYMWECPICGANEFEYDFDTKANIVTIICTGSEEHIHKYDLIKLIEENKFEEIEE